MDLTAPPFPDSDRRKANALWLLKHCTGQRVSSALVGGWRARVDARMAAALPDDGELLPLPEAPADAASFVASGMSQPVVFRGAAKDWEAIRNFKPAYFKEHYGDVPIRLLRTATGDVGDQDYAPQDCTLGEAIDRFDEGDAAYCRFLPVISQHPELLRQLDLEWCRARRKSGAFQDNAQMFMGGAGTSTALHTALSSNMFVQTHGQKRWKLYAPEWAWVFEPPMDRSLYFMSGFDPDAPDFERFPAARGLRGYDVVLEPGDVLFNPPFWWHKVSNPTVSIGIGCRWLNPREMWRHSRILSLLTALAVDPPLFYGRAAGLDFTKIFITRPFTVKYRGRKSR